MIGGRSSTSRVAASATALDRDTSVAVFGSHPSFVYSKPRGDGGGPRARPWRGAWRRFRVGPLAVEVVEEITTILHTLRYVPRLGRIENY